MSEIIEDNLRYRQTGTYTPVCSDCKKECFIVPDNEVHPEDMAGYSEALKRPEFEVHVFAYCKGCNSLLLFGAGRFNPKHN